MCNDREVLGPWANGRWQNLLSLAIVLSLFVLSATLMITTVLPSTPVIPLLVVLSALALVAFCVDRAPAVRPRARASWRRRRAGAAHLADARGSRCSRGRRQGTGRRVLFALLGAYLAVSSVLLVVRVVRLAVA